MKMDGFTPHDDASGADEDADGFLRRLGARVREARAGSGLSRKAVAERSGVSERYLARLEGGDGNISIALLRRVALALGMPLDRLVADRPHPGERAQRVTLIGLRGAGKSTLGRLAAEALGVPFLELNAEIEQACGMPVGEVMALYGQEGYRQLERQAVERVAAAHDRLVLAVAGGIVSEPATFEFLLRHFHTIWLRARPEEHMARVRAQGDERPMAGNPAAMQELRRILTGREALYARAEAQVDTSGRSLEHSLRDLVAMVAGRGFLSAPG